MKSSEGMPFGSMYIITSATNIRTINSIQCKICNIEIAAEWQIFIGDYEKKFKLKCGYRFGNYRVIALQGEQVIRFCSISQLI